MLSVRDANLLQLEQIGFFMPNNVHLSYPFVPEHPYLVAVSGGPDSLCLLDLMGQQPGVDVLVAHYNHHLRPEADAEADYVRSLAAKMDLPFLLGNGDVQVYARDKGVSTEEAARWLRYGFLFEQAKEHLASGIVTAHTADDQVETILMHLLRGTGMAGLRGMKEVTYLPTFDAHIPLIRPMLHIWRREVEAYCHSHGLEPVFDATNQDQIFTRNRVRHSLIPEMERYNPQVKSALLRMARTVSEDYDVINSAVEQIWSKALLTSGNGYLAFSIPALRDVQPAVLRPLFRRAIQTVLGEVVDINHDALQRAVFLLVQRNGCPIPEQVDLIGGVYAFLEERKIILAMRGTDIPAGDWPQVSEELEFGTGEHVLGNGWILAAQLIPGGNPPDADPWSAWLDADLAGDRLTVRPRHAGDRFQPLGMDGKSMKLQDFLVNVKMPARARNRWPIICAGDAVVWIPGYRLAHPFRVTDGTNQVMKLVLMRSPK